MKTATFLHLFLFICLVLIDVAHVIQQQMPSLAGQILTSCAMNMLHSDTTSSTTAFNFVHMAIRGLFMHSGIHVHGVTEMLPYECHSYRRSASKRTDVL